MNRPLVAAGLYLISNIGIACDLSKAEMVELDSDVTLYYRIEPAPLRVAQHFSMLFRACQGGQTLKPDAFKVDALMPKHGHGMNYKADIEIQPNGLVAARLAMTVSSAETAVGSKVSKTINSRHCEQREAISSS